MGGVSRREAYASLGKKSDYAVRDEWVGKVGQSACTTVVADSSDQLKQVACAEVNEYC